MTVIDIAPQSKLAFLSNPAIKPNSIREFINGWRVVSPVKYTRIHTDQECVTWDQRLKSAGYYSIKISGPNCIDRWEDIHDWCKEKFGNDHYAWTGTVFWFEREQHAVWFALRWS